MRRRVDTEALERKLRPIYDAFDSRNYKMAVKLASSAMQRYPEEHMFSILKAVALEKLGKIEEAVQLCRETLARTPTDDHVLSTASLVMKAAHQHELTMAYEAASAREPKNERLMEGLFSCYGRESNFVKQQQVATRLLKAFGGPHYPWWVVTTLVLQARQGIQGTASEPIQAGVMMEPHKLLALAQSMVQRQLARDNKFPSYDAAMLFLDILVAQGKFEEGLTVLEGPLGDIIAIPDERTALRATLLAAAGRRREAASLASSLLEHQPDNWSYLLLLLDCLLPTTREGHRVQMFGLVCGRKSLEEAMQKLASDYTSNNLEVDVREATQRVEDLFLISQTQTAVGEVNGLPPATSGAKSKSHMRGPSLARVELSHRLLKLQRHTQVDFAEAIFQHFNLWGHLTSCAADLRDYTRRVEGEGKVWLSSAVQPAIAVNPEEFISPSNGKEASTKLRRVVCALQIQNDLGLPEFYQVSDACEYACRLMRIFSASLPLYDDLDRRERGPADELVTMAASALMSALSISPQDLHLMILAVLLLEAGVVRRPYSAPMRLALCSLYGLLGCSSRCTEQCRLLEIKHIQLDTLAGHHLLPVVRGLAAETASLQLLNDMTALFGDHHRDAGDSIMQAFTYGSYAKVVDFVAFTERLNSSHTRALALAELVVCRISKVLCQGYAEAHQEVLRGCRSLPFSGASPLGWREMRFNHDLANRPAWYGPCKTACHMTIPYWWEHLSGMKVPGIGRCWWSAPGAVDSSCSAAEALRKSWTLATRRRWLLPHLLAGALSLPEDSNSTGSVLGQRLSLAQAVAELATAYGIEQTDIERVLEETFTSPVGGSTCGSASGTTVCQLLDLALFSLALVALDLIPCGEGPDISLPVISSTSFTFCRRAECLSRGCEVVVQHITSGMAPETNQGALTGGPMALAAVFLDEVLVWVVLCLQAWSRAFKDGRKKGKAAGRKKAASQIPLADEPYQKATEALSQLVVTLVRCCQSVGEVCDRLVLISAEDRQGHLDQEVLSSQQEVSSVLYGWEGGLQVGSTLRGLLQEQMDEVALLRSLAERWRGELEALEL